MSTVLDRFLHTVERVPDRTFLVAAQSAPMRRLTYGEVRRRAAAFAHQLVRSGVSAGDRVVLNCTNSVEYICAYFGVWLAGATAVPVDPRSRPAHVNRVYEDCGARCLIAAARKPDLDPAVRQIGLDEIDWDADPGDVPHASHRNPLALISYTSGTTGVPRGVCLSQDNLEYTRAAITGWAHVGEADRELTTLSLTHLFGLAHIHVYAALGAAVYIEDGVRDVPRLLSIIEDEGITSFPGTPAGFRIIVDRFGELLRTKARGLRYSVINTAPMPVEYVEKLLALLPETELYMYYGLTEASRSTYLAYREHPQKLETVGRPAPGARVRVGTAADPLVGEPGEILVSGPHVTSGYWGRDSSEFFDAGWFRTGDLGVLDADGFLTWLGRVREQININGLKLVPSEVEDVLRLDSRVVDCAVVGAPDAMTGEAVVAFVVPREPRDAQFAMALRKLCHKHLEEYKVPKRIIMISEIPKTDSGKVKRLSLKEHLLGEGESPATKRA